MTCTGAFGEETGQWTERETLTSKQCTESVFMLRNPCENFDIYLTDVDQ